MRIRYKQLLLGLVGGALAFIVSPALIARGCTRNSTMTDIVVANVVVVVFIVLPATRKLVQSSVLWCALALPLSLVITFGYYT